MYFVHSYKLFIHSLSEWLSLTMQPLRYDYICVTERLAKKKRGKMLEFASFCSFYWIIHKNRSVMLLPYARSICSCRSARRRRARCIPFPGCTAPPRARAFPYIPTYDVPPLFGDGTFYVEKAQLMPPPAALPPARKTAPQKFFAGGPKRLTRPHVCGIIEFRPQEAPPAKAARGGPRRHGARAARKTKPPVRQGIFYGGKTI